MKSIFFVFAMLLSTVVPAKSILVSIPSTHGGTISHIMNLNKIAMENWKIKTYRKLDRDGTFDFCIDFTLSGYDERFLKAVKRYEDVEVETLEDCL